ncbi:ABC transporter permease [Roseibium album]|uniref:Inner membrane transport permease YhhJ n=1 Tax=Roseibium album TaxID=311410 RepID=A0A0M7AWH7_9HYPH|nr:ABC transporter permease [Roseibium album]CTQ63124.1 Inner membrane transport permease YhhJ [Roseibium album]CTQ79249.1 Inner membrane transport permease YhhJ [Roseibium album]CTQ80780.1 Inner membrane transport permease YhhJ [Roseibium album]
MRRVQIIFWLGLKEMVSLRRDWVMMALLLYSFTLAPVMEATGVSTSVNNASIAFADEDNSPLSRTLAAAFFPPEFQPVVQIEPGTGSSQMDAGRFLFVVSIPPGFEQDVRAARTPEIQILIDATAMEQAGIGSNYITNILSAEIQKFASGADLARRSLIDLVIHSAFNPNRDTVQFAGVVSIIGQIMWLTTILTGAAMIREREHGTIEHLLAMPIAPFDIAAAKIWANAAVVLVAASLSITFVLEGFLGVTIVGSKVLFLTGTAVFLFTATALGVFIATLARSMAQFALLVMLTVLPMLMLSGGETPVESQPDWLQSVTVILPSRHFIAFSQAVVYKGAGLETVWPEFLWIALLGVALLLFSLLTFRRSITQDR